MSGTTDQRDVPTTEGLSIAEAMERAAVDGYLGDPQVVQDLLRALVGRVTDRLAKGGDTGADMTDALATVEIFHGKHPGFTATTMNTPAAMDAHVLAQMPEVMDGMDDAGATFAAVVDFIGNIYDATTLEMNGRTQESRGAMDDALFDFSRLFTGLALEDPAIDPEA